MKLCFQVTFSLALPLSLLKLHVIAIVVVAVVIREFKKLPRRRQRERHKTIGFNEKTKALHVRFKFWYISLPYSAKQQREMVKFKVWWRMKNPPSCARVLRKTFFLVISRCCFAEASDCFI